MSEPGWRPLRKPRPENPSDAFVSTPFAKLARTHAFSVAGDALIAIALAGSLFFDIDPNAARWRVALYLLLTMAPFAVVAPLIGPAIDRAKSGRRWMIVGSAALRVVICIFMVGDLDSLLLFPEAFAVLVLGKGYQVAKSAVVPGLVPHGCRAGRGQLEAAADLGAGRVRGGRARPPAAQVRRTGVGRGPRRHGVRGGRPHRHRGSRPCRWRPNRPTRPSAPSCTASGIQLAAGAMGVLRGVVGFLAFLLAFELRRNEDPTWYFGVIVGASAIGGLIGAALAPRIRKTTAEEDMLIGSLGVAVIVGLLVAWTGGLVGATVIAMAIGLAAATGKLAFDSIVQRDAPDANRGRSFARFETRFQIIWVLGAFIPVVIPLPARLGFLIVALAAAFAIVVLHPRPPSRARAGRAPGLPSSAARSGPARGRTASPDDFPGRRRGTPTPF